MTKYYALIGPKLDGPALNSAMTACSIEPSIRQVPRLYVNRMEPTVYVLYCVITLFLASHAAQEFTKISVISAASWR